MDKLCWEANRSTMSTGTMRPRRIIFPNQLKAERPSADQDAQTADFTPSQEDSLDRLLAMDKQFAA